jgi:catechol 2,3-dioxygenase-like lactoylglutathione lyase family enzyme
MPGPAAYPYGKRTEVRVLGNKDVIATIGVRDLDRAKKFYEGKLGLSPAPSEEKSVLNYKSGKSTLMVYVSEFAGTNKATAATWIVDDVEELARALKGKGVAFEHYDFPGMTRKGDVHFAGDLKNAWAKDPDGNILGFVSK